jgi:tetratricopeptide (TPR) repeat protein
LLTVGIVGGLGHFGLRKSGDAASMTITQEGAPAALASAAPPAQSDSLDLAAAANAHGTLQQDRAPTVAATATAAIAPDLQAVAQGDLPGSPAAADDLGSQSVAKSANAYGNGPGAIGGGMIPPAAASAAPQAAQAAEVAAPATRGSTASADFAAATAAYHAQNYDEATRDFDALAAAGDDNAALWAARSVRDGNGCAAAVNRFDQLAGRAYGKTTPGYDATFEAGQCYKSMGSFDAARQRFARLLTVPSYAARAQAELNKMAPSTSHAAPAPRAIKPAPANAQQMNNSAF